MNSNKKFTSEKNYLNFKCKYCSKIGLKPSEFRNVVARRKPKRLNIKTMLDDDH